MVEEGDSFHLKLRYMTLGSVSVQRMDLDGEQMLSFSRKTQVTAYQPSSSSLTGPIFISMLSISIWLFAFRHDLPPVLW